MSSGGLKPLASLGFFEFLDEEDIQIDLWVACSGGGIMTALRNIGLDSSQIIETTREFLAQKIFSKIDFQTLFNIARVPFTSFEFNRGLLKEKPATYLGAQGFR